MKRVLVLLAACLVLMPAYARAQVVLGTVTDQITRAPVRGAFVQLLDGASGRLVSGVLTNERGGFALRAPAGRYALKVERIGHRTGTVPSFPLMVGETRTFSVALEVAALQLKEISVSGGARCTSRPAESRETAQVWEEARKALTVAAWVESTGAVFQTRAYQRDLDADLRPVGNTIYRFRNTRGKQAFSAEQADTLARYGYIRERSGDTFLYGPDAELLLSNSFLAQHCFKLERRADRPGLLGLAFTPVSGRRLPDIEGTLWLDQRTAELRYIEYGYTGREMFTDRRYAGGRTEFEELPNGAWVVRRWHLRSPQLARSRTGRPAQVVGTHEEGAEILDADVLSGGTMRLVPRYTIAGVVYDSLHQTTLAGARVYLSGTPFSTVSGIDGRFVLDSVPAGDYSLSFAHPILDSIPEYPAPRPISVAGPSSAFNISTPSVLTAIHSRCTEEEIRQAREITRDTSAVGGALLYGLVSNEFGPVAGVRVAARWQRVLAAARNANVPLNQISVTPLEIFSESDEKGNFALCGLGVGRMLQLRIEHGPSIVMRDSVKIAEPGIRRFDVKLRR